MVHLLAALSLLAASYARAQETDPRTIRPEAVQTEAAPMQCVAFSPYVGNLNPNYGSHPTPELINRLLDILVRETPFRCIMTYGVLNGLDVTFAAAKARGLKVIAILWLDQYPEINSQSIAKGIEVAKAYSETITLLSCGSEVRTRHGNRLDGEIKRCIDALREAKVGQPVTSIDIWWEWCNRTLPCQKTSLADSVDWIGINIFPWWENKFAGVFTCTSAMQAADFHRARIEDIERTYPGKRVVMTEFGWPSRPEGGTERNLNSGESCGIAGKKNQMQVIRSTLKMLKETRRSGVVFEAFSENWKPSNEGQFGNAWGICQGEPPYSCLPDLLPNAD